MTQEQVLDKYAKARTDVLTAVREIRRNKLANPNITEKRVCYMEIRCWIKINLGYEMENVEARCRELAREISPPQIVIEYDSYGWAWVSPRIEGMGL